MVQYALRLCIKAHILLIYSIFKLYHLFSFKERDKTLLLDLWKQNQQSLKGNFFES